ncbi:hypothetical protein [Ectothiorhodospira mobilis]|uniref:hypothetical protein n=1 Tax=Ectothiorhodospira mobilis TaxID=195064 RepID=UPI001902CBE2|nr:hypothetical protein [Ectothiorhodospira mobilis]MBK1691203.1 hypothetical protein [Ectothiorhodospira mobilis]
MDKDRFVVLSAQAVEGRFEAWTVVLTSKASYAQGQRVGRLIYGWEVMMDRGLAGSGAGSRLAKASGAAPSLQLVDAYGRHRMVAGQPARKESSEKSAKEAL